MDHQQRFASEHGYFSYVVSGRTGENVRFCKELQDTLRSLIDVRF